MDQTFAHPIVEGGRGNQFALSSRGQLCRITSQPRHMWIIPVRCSTPRQLKPDGAVMPPKKPTDLTKARSPLIFRKDHATFLGVQVLLVFFHSDIRYPSGFRCRISILSPRNFKECTFEGAALVYSGNGFYGFENSKF